MKYIAHKVISLVLIFCLLFSLSGCVFDKWGEDIADGIIDDTKKDIDSSKNDQLPYNPNGNVLYETISVEDALKENLLTEEKLEESTINQLLLQEELLAEDILIESVSVQILDSVSDLDDCFECESYYSQQLDYSLIRQRIARGASMVIAEVVVDLSNCILEICTCNWGALALDAGQIIVTVGSTTLAAFVAYQTALAKSMAAGNSYEIALYDALDSASNAFYYAAVTCEVVNTVISIAQSVKAITDAAKSIKDLVKVIKAGEILDDAGRVIAKTDANGTLSVNKDGKWRKCNYAGESTDLYDIKTKEYVATVVKSGDDTVRLVAKNIPDSIYSSSGKLKYVCQGNDIWNVTETSMGDIVRTYKGTVDAGGFVKNGFGQIIDRIDFSTGKSIDAFSGIAKTAPNVSCDVFGNFIDLNTGKALSIKMIDGVMTYLDSKGNAVFKQYVGDDGFTYLKRISDVDNGKTIGRLSKDGTQLDPTWKVELNKTRYEATQTIRKCLVEYVQNHSIQEIRANFPDLSLEQIDYIKEFGKVPTSIQIHHWKNVANYPDHAGDLSNLEVLSRSNHLKAHGGNFQNSTNSPTLNYVNLKKLFGLGG